jgi:hypothetical protein
VAFHVPSPKGGFCVILVEQEIFKCGDSIFDSPLYSRKNTTYSRELLFLICISAKVNWVFRHEIESIEYSFIYSLLYIWISPLNISFVLVHSLDSKELISRYIIHLLRDQLRISRSSITDIYEHILLRCNQEKTL